MVSSKFYTDIEIRPNPFNNPVYLIKRRPTVSLRSVSESSYSDLTSFKLKGILTMEGAKVCRTLRKWYLQYLLCFYVGPE